MAIPTTAPITECPTTLVMGNAGNAQALLEVIRETRKIHVSDAEDSGTSVHCLPSSSLLGQIESLSKFLSSTQYVRESDTLKDVLELCVTGTDFGGLGLELGKATSPEEDVDVLLLVAAWMEALNSADRAKTTLNASLPERPKGRRAMTMSEKIFAAHDVQQRGSVSPGDLIRVDVDWILASEASWGGMEASYNELGKPGIFRNDRFWLAGDHVVDPRVNELPHIKNLIQASERARRVFKMTDYQGMNYTIMHTEFFRERAQPGMLVIGSDSHTCSAGAVGCMAVGLGVADVTLPLVTGETWFKVPETINISIVGAPSPGIGGKDTILYIMKEFKRNTVASQRIVEFTGPGLKHLSCDARFAIANMTTEFGGITGIFEPDAVTLRFLQNRRSIKHKKATRFFRPDNDAVYAGTFEIDLSKVTSFVALYPSPDHVVPVTSIEGQSLDGCFIGACTTAEEDLILGALVLEQGLKKGYVPVKRGKRKMVPGSLPILNNLRKLGFIDVYEQAGFEVGIPGCSYCVGMSADRAEEGEVWLSSQNRNFQNRMGIGSIGNLASAVTVAASSFGMVVTDPQQLLDCIDMDQADKILGRKKVSLPNRDPVYVEPSETEKTCTITEAEAEATQSTDLESPILAMTTQVLRGKVQRLGDFIDTDALAPAEHLIHAKTNEALGAHCLEHTHPDFRSRVREGLNVVVAGEAFGCGSSREQAVSALLGSGVICVIAKSFGFIYSRNQPNLGLLGITINNEQFYDASVDGAEIVIDLGNAYITVGGREYRFQLSQMEKELIKSGGLTAAFKRFGKHLFDTTVASRQGIWGGNDDWPMVDTNSYEEWRQ